MEHDECVWILSGRTGMSYIQVPEKHRQNWEILRLNLTKRERKDKSMKIFTSEIIQTKFQILSSNFF